MIKKRLFSALLVLALCLTLLPTQVFAYLGGTDAPLVNPAQAELKNEGTIDGSQIYSLTMTGGQLKFSLAVGGEHAGKSVTASVRSEMPFASSVANGVYEQARFTLQTSGTTQKALTIEKMEVVTDFTNMPVAKFENALTVRYTFSGYGRLDPEVECYVTYYFVKLGDGATDGVVSNDAKDSTNSHTYALAARATWQTTEDTDNTSQYVFRYFQDYHGFSRMGHGSLTESAAHVKLSRTYENSTGEIVTTAKSTDITTGLGRTTMGQTYGYGSISEIYSDSYGVDSPFVLADRERIGNINDISTPNYMTYDAASDCLIAEGNTKISQDGQDYRDSMNALHIWGFRDVYTKTEAAASSEVKFTKPDAVTIPQDADKLGLYATDSGFAVAVITDAAQEKVLKKRYGADPLYTLRGSFEKKSDDGGDYYEFTDGKVALTSTITATWLGNAQHFRVRVDKDGVFTAFDTTAGVNYTTPGFKLYSPADGVTDVAALTLQTTTEDGESETCLTLKMEPEKNDVLVFIDIPEVSSKIDTALLKPDGNLILSGQMGLDLILNCSSDRLATLEALGYGPKENADGTVSFVQNGIKAEGSLDTGSLLGLDLAEIEAAINTFEGEEQYDFSLELNAFDLFETAAELSLKRISNGRLVPNDLYFKLAAGPGIPLVPPIPTAFLKGGGGGFYGLADTINGDYIAIPPMRLKLSAKGDYVKIIEGWLNVTLGPSYLEYSGDDITIAKADVLKEFNMYLKLAGEKRQYQGKTYTGLRAGGGMGVTIQAPKDEDSAIFEVSGSVEASMFGGLDDYKEPTSAYIQLDSRGSIEAEVKIPKQLGKVKFKALGGKKLADTTVDFILGAQTAVTVDEEDYAGKNVGEILEIASTSAWDNLSVYGGVSNKGTLLLINYRIYYIIPDKFGGAIDLFWNEMDDWSLEDEIGDNAWSVSGKNSAQTLSAGDSWLTEVGKCCDAETGEQIGIAVMETSLYELPVETGAGDDGIALLATQAENGRYKETVNYSVDSKLPSDADNLLLRIFAKDGNPEELRNSLTITQDGSQLTLVDPEYDSKGNIINIAAINCTEIEEDNESGLLIATGLDAKNTHSITIEADCDFTTAFAATAAPTTLELDLTSSTSSSYQAASTIQNGREGKTYAVRYYLDTQKNREGEHYFLDMNELGKNRTDDTFQIFTEGALAPTGDYYVTAVLVEKVTGDFNGDGTDEYSWVTVDTKTSNTAIHYTNNTTPESPENVKLEFTGNETLTATWDKVDNADGYRVTLYYQDGSEWKQAGGSYVLENADFAADSKITAASTTVSGGYSLRMAPTVSGTSVTVSESETITKTDGTSDEAPTEHDYKVTVEAFKRQSNETYTVTKQNADGTKKTVEKKLNPYDVSYSSPTESGQVLLEKYTAPEITVEYGDEGQSITLNGTSGYDTLTWNTLKNDGEWLFSVRAEDGGVTVAVTSEQGGTSLNESDGRVLANAGINALISNGGRVKLTVTKNSDLTTYYLRLVLDDIAPVLTLDSGSVAADPTTGKYTVTGTTEPGLTVTLADSNATPVKADAEGRFALTGTLTKNSDPAMNETEGFVSLLSEVSTQDAAGNEADPAAVVITARAQDPDTPDAPVTPVTPSDGGSSGYTPGNSITVEKAEHGSVTVSTKSAGKGSTVTVTVTPDKGYTLETLTVTDASGKKLTLTGKGDGKYTFTMPSSKVTVKATFMEDNAMLNFFVDVKAGDYYYDAVLWAAQKGITSGISATEFGPNQPCTRAQIVTFLWRTAGSPEPKNVSSFTDVPANSYYTKAVAWAVENGITVGTGTDTFSPNESCTRAQAVTFLARALNAKASGKATFSDVPTGSYYSDAVAWAAESGVTTGTSAVTFSPDDVCTRAQIVTFLWRAYNNSK